MRPLTLSEAYHRINNGPRAEHAVDEFLDMFYGLRTAEARCASIIEEPPLTDDPIDNAIAAAIAEYLSNQYELPVVPIWTYESKRILDEPYFFGHIDAPAWIEYMVHSSPPEYRARNLFTEERPLRRARQPAADNAMIDAKINLHADVVGRVTNNKAA